MRPRPIEPNVPPSNLDQALVGGVALRKCDAAGSGPDIPDRLVRRDTRRDVIAPRLFWPPGECRGASNLRTILVFRAAGSNLVREPGGDDRDPARASSDLPQEPAAAPDMSAAGPAGQPAAHESAAARILLRPRRPRSASGAATMRYWSAAGVSRRTRATKPRDSCPPAPRNCSGGTGVTGYRSQASPCCSRPRCTCTSRSRHRVTP
jgi:hypothetical protein